MSELSKAIKRWGNNEEDFNNYLNTKSKREIIVLEEEIERAIIHGRPFSLDIITSLFAKPYNIKILNDMLVTVEKKIQERSIWELEQIQKYLQEVQPIVEKGIKNGKITFMERIRLKTGLELAYEHAIDIRIEVSDE